MEEELRLVKEERREFIKEKGRKIVFQAKVQHMEENERCTRYFFQKGAWK